jgi:hypothetical protein
VEKVKGDKVNRSNTMVEHLSYHPMVEGLSLVTAASTGRQEMW